MPDVNPNVDGICNKLLWISKLDLRWSRIYVLLSNYRKIYVWKFVDGTFVTIFKFMNIIHREYQIHLWNALKVSCSSFLRSNNYFKDTWSILFIGFLSKSTPINRILWVTNERALNVEEIGFGSYLLSTLYTCWIQTVSSEWKPILGLPW